jgi:predicted metal-binding membrane protein
VISIRSAGLPLRLELAGLAIAGAWLLAVILHLLGAEETLHHHHLIEGDLPLWTSTAVFLVAWQVMVVAMMLPGSLPAIRSLGSRPERGRSVLLGWAAFLGAYLLVWTAFGLLAFGGDVVIHRLVESSPWFADRSFLVEAGILAVAGGYQFAPLKRRALALCRHPGEAEGNAAGSDPSAAAGLRHSLHCVASSWALMLVMFAAGVSSLTWMAVLTGVMAYEVLGAHGQRAASLAGIILIGGASVVVLTGGAMSIFGGQ